MDGVGLIVLQNQLRDLIKEKRRQKGNMTHSSDLDEINSMIEAVKEKIEKKRQKILKGAK